MYFQWAWVAHDSSSYLFSSSRISSTLLPFFLSRNILIMSSKHMNDWGKFTSGKLRIVDNTWVLLEGACQFETLQKLYIYTLYNIK